MVFRLSGICLLKFKNSSLNQSSIQGNLCDDQQPRKRSEFSNSHRVLQGSFSTWNPPSRAQGASLQNCTVELPRNHFSEIHFDKFLDPSTFQCWKTSYVFLINHLHQVNRQHHVLEMYMQEVFDLHVANCLSPNPGRCVANMSELERHTESFAIPSPRFVRKFPAWNRPSHAEAAHRQNCAVAPQRSQEMHLD